MKRMQPFSLKCHPPGAAAPPSTFFLLSRGKNAGRPSCSPNPNCFAFTCSPADLDGYYLLVFALWKTGAFARCLFGTAVPFIRIGDVRRCISAYSNGLGCPKDLLLALDQITQLETQCRSRLSVLAQLRLSLLQQALATASPPATLSEADQSPFIFSLIQSNQNDKQKEEVDPEGVPDHIAHA